MAKKGYESEKTGRKVDELLDKIDNLNVPEWALQESKPSYTAQEVHALPENTSIPKKTSDLVNDRGFITQESDPTVPSWAKQPSKPTYTAEEVGALSEDTPIFSGDYNDLRNKPTIPTVPENVSAFNNDAGYLTDEDMGDYATKQELNGKQDTINDLGSIRSGASAGATAYQLPQSGVPESDLSQGVKDKINEKEVFWATYGTTTAQEIDAAVAAGKEVMCIRGNYVYRYTTTIAGFRTFIAVYNNTVFAVRVNSLDGWTNISWDFQNTQNRVSSWQATPDNTHYPSEKLVKDSLDVKADLSSMSKWGVVSQEITWTADEYSLSNQVYGMIPIANIDLFKMGGAEFNDSDTDLSVTDMYGRTYTHKAGCFKLNGLGDISYQEMLTIYTEARMSQPFMTSNGEPAPRYLEKTKARTNMWNLPSNWNTGGSLYGLGMYNADGNLTTIGLGFRDDANGFYPKACRQMLNACPRVKYVYPVLNCQNITGTGSAANTFYLAFSKAYKLQEIRLKALKISVPFGSCSELSIASVVYMIQNEASTSAITITLHPTAYARAIAYSDVQTALSNHTNVTLASA